MHKAKCVLQLLSHRQQTSVFGYKITYYLSIIAEETDISIVCVSFLSLKNSIEDIADWRNNRRSWRQEH